MKKFFTLTLGLILVLAASAQLNPVNWTFTATKIGENKYEVHMKANIQSGWHLYAQQQPDNAVIDPTSFKFSKNPLLEVEGKVKEVGTVERFHDAKLDISANQYSKSVDFIQVVKVKSKVKTNLVGSLQYQTCDDKKCLPTKTVNFSIVLE